MAASWKDVREGRACRSCGSRRGPLFVIRRWAPGRKGCGIFWGQARCLDRAACAERIERAKTLAARRRGALIVSAPAAPDAPMGWCRWCGAKLTGARAGVRRYCYLDREGRDCVAAWRENHTYDTRAAVRSKARAEGKSELRCVDCGFLCERLLGEGRFDGAGCRAWEADHEIPLEDGGPHTVENLRCRCEECHGVKTARENAARRVLD